MLYDKPKIEYIFMQRPAFLQGYGRFFKRLLFLENGSLFPHTVFDIPRARATAPNAAAVKNIAAISAAENLLKKYIDRPACAGRKPVLAEMTEGRL